MMMHWCASSREQRESISVLETDQSELPESCLDQIKSSEQRLTTSMKHLLLKLQEQTISVLGQLSDPSPKVMQ